MEVPENSLGQPGCTSTLTYTRALLQGIHIFLRKAWGEHEPQVDKLFKLRTLGIESAPSSQTGPKNLFSQQSNIPIAATGQAVLYSQPRWFCSANPSLVRAGQGRAQRGAAQCPGQLSPVRVKGALVPLDAWGRVPRGRALKDAGVIGWHLDFTDAWRSCWRSHTNSECCDQRKSTSPMLWFTFHA